MSACLVLRDAIMAAQRLGKAIDPCWPQIAANMVLPKRGKVIVSHEAYRRNEEKGSTPDPLMGVFPLGFDLDEETERATLVYYLGTARRYIGSPMLSALYGVWAARTGNRQLSADLLHEGYARFCSARFMQSLGPDLSSPTWAASS
jgi:protein-glucosylgalactosylhydroxylysine glucosidase